MDFVEVHAVWTGLVDFLPVDALQVVLARLPVPALNLLLASHFRTPLAPSGNSVTLGQTSDEPTFSLLVVEDLTGTAVPDVDPTALTLVVEAVASWMGEGLAFFALGFAMPAS